MKKILLLCALLALLGCSSKEVEQPGGILEPVTVSQVHRILVLPFTCNILPVENEATTVMLQNQLAAQTVYLLQSAGVPAEQYVIDMSDWQGSQPASYASLLPSAYGPGGGGLPMPGKLNQGSLTATTFEEVTDWDTQVVPPRGMREFGAPMPYTAVGDTEFVPVPVDKEPKIFEERQKILEEARIRGYDYVVSGTIALVRTEVSPTVKVAGSERATIRAELNCAFQLLSTRDGRVGKAGPTRGRDAKMIVVKEGSLNSFHLYSALDKVMQQSTFYAAKRVAEGLTDRKLDDVILQDELQEESEYYQDSPGKRLRPEPED